MSRRDTIIIAALINAGLLLILFATAMRTDTGVEGPETVSQQTLADNAASSIESEVATLPAADGGSIPVELPAVAQVVQPTAEEFPLTEATAQVESETPPVSEAIATSSGGSDDYVEVTVKRGDVLERIARNNGTSVSEIMKVNGLKKTNLHIGQVLRIPISSMPSTATAATTPKSSKAKQTKSASITPKAPKANRKAAIADAEMDTALPSGADGAKYYVVQNGDSPWLIANKNKIPLEKLLRLNNLNEESARKLHPGDKIRIR